MRKPTALIIVFLGTAALGSLFHFSQFIGMRVEDIPVSDLGRIFGFAFIEAAVATLLTFVGMSRIKIEK
jgi:hypothetical protein